mmetsp:Transcript_68387/g.154694  ORF Transcript_68387/g.154694 Transcript_68387/m.154694 type:complete len:81 (+) Transcript_68387:319-561(+)
MGASVDSGEANKAFAEKFTFTFPLLCDTDFSMTKAFDVCKNDDCTMSARVTYVVDTDGKIEQCIDPFSAQDGAAALLNSL